MATVFILEKYKSEAEIILYFTSVTFLKDRILSDHICVSTAASHHRKIILE